MGLYQFILKTLLVVILMVAVTSCKIGKDDPVFTILSRKQRLTGEWKIKSAEWTMGDTNVTLADGELVTVLGDSTLEDGILAEYQFTFQKTGVYEFIKSITYPENYNGSNGPSITYKIEESGIWSFAGDFDNEKSKSHLLIVKETSIQTIAGGGSNISATDIKGANEGVLYEIDMLKNKEITLSFDVKKSHPFGESHKTGKLNLKAI